VSILLQFVYLQVLDVLTTLTFLTQGVGEANPVVRWAMSVSPNALTGLVVVKLFAVGFALTCVYRSRLALLKGVNYCFAGLIVYNMIVIIISSPTLAVVQ